MAIHTESIPPYRRRDERTGPSLREIACRRCGRWIKQHDDMRWYHAADDTIACLDPDTMAPYQDERLVPLRLSALRCSPVAPQPHHSTDDPKESTMTTQTLDLTTATPAELRAECDRLGLHYRTKDDRKALTRKILSARPSAIDVAVHDHLLDEKTFGRAVGAVLSGADPIATADALVGGTPEQLNAAANRVERMKLGKAEAAAMKAWRKAGAKGSKPPTPNLDALNAETSGPRKATGAKSTKSTKTSAAKPARPTSSRADQYRAANDAMKAQRAAKVRRTGTKLGDSDVRDLIRGILAEHPDATMGGELLVARWLRGVSMDRYRWNGLWAEVAAEKSARK